MIPAEGSRGGVGGKDAGTPPIFSPYRFRVPAITDLFSQHVPPEGVQYLAGHANPRTTQRL